MNMMYKTSTYRGKPIGEMSKEELVEALNFLANDAKNEREEHIRQLEVLSSTDNARQSFRRVENNKDRFVDFISWLAAGCVFLGVSLGAIVTIAIVRFSSNDPYAFAFVAALVGSLCFRVMPRPKRNHKVV